MHSERRHVKGRNTSFTVLFFLNFCLLAFSPTKFASHDACKVSAIIPSSQLNVICQANVLHFHFERWNILSAQIAKKTNASSLERAQPRSHGNKYCINIAQLQMLHPCPLSISCRAGRSEGDKAAISRSTVATQPRGGTVAGQIFFSKKIHIYPKPKFQGVSYNRKAFPIWWWWWIRTVEAQDCPVLAPLVSGNPTFRRCLANTRPIRPLHSHDPAGDYHHRINHMSTTKDYK